MLNRLRHERGQDLVEFALVMPVILLLLLGIAQVAIVVLSYNTIEDAARQGARLGVILDNADNRNLILGAVYRVTDAAGIDGAKLTIGPVPFRQVDGTIRVEVTYDMEPIFRFSGSQVITLRAASTKLIELQ